MKTAKTALALLSAYLLSAAAFAQGPSGAWTFQDQFGASVDIRIGSGRAAVMIVSDKREAAEEIAAWEKLLGPLPPGTAVFRVANLKAIPFFVPKGSVSKDLKGNYPSMSLALDWKGELSSALAAPKRETAVLVFAPDGTELARVAGPASAAGAAKVREGLARAK